MEQRLGLRRFAGVEDFESRALAFLLEREAQNNLFIGICTQIREDRYTDPYLAVVEHGDEVVAAAFRTPPFQLGLSHVADPNAVRVIAEDVRAAFDSLPGVQASTEDARAFAGIWSELARQTSSLGMQNRIYQANEVQAPESVPGQLREATSGDRELLIEWMAAFNAEALAGDPVTHNPAELVDYRLGGSSSPLFLWWTDEPVSMAGASGPTPNGIRLNAVYTPPELRRRGYAGACVAALTQRLLDGGRSFVFLYTDLANPTSNSIYQKIGYRPVCDVDQYRFD